jgi:L-2-hydroxyglutarate oxidase LhgO
VGEAKTADVLIVGAGIIGLTLARELLARGYGSIVILEKEAAPGAHASGRNSGVLHAGIYYAAGTLKAKSCLSGNRLMRAYCREQKLPLLEAGKVIVARSESELPALDELYKRATANGATVELVDERQLTEIEPCALTVNRAIWSKETSCVDPRRVVARLREELDASGKVKVVTNARFTGLRKPRTAKTTQGDFAFGRLVNAAGAYCDEVARPFGLGGEYRLIPFKGIYRKLKKGAFFDVRGNIYPVPDVRNPFLGVHFTRSVSGDLYVGPTAIPAFGRENYSLFAGAFPQGFAIAAADAALFFKNARFRDVALTEPKKYFSRFFHQDAAKLVKTYHSSMFEPSTKVGIRPQLVDWKTKELVMDFVIQAREDSVHVLNPISPAFTCSMDLAKRIADEHFVR